MKGYSATYFGLLIIFTGMLLTTIVFMLIYKQFKISIIGFLMKNKFSILTTIAVFSSVLLILRDWRLTEEDYTLAIGITILWIVAMISYSKITKKP